MKKDELLSAVAEQFQVTKGDAEAIIAGFFRVTEAALKSHGEIKWPHIGTFVVKDIPARKVRSPRTGEMVDAPAHRKVSFKPATALKDVVNG